MKMKLVLLLVLITVLISCQTNKKEDIRINTDTELPKENKIPSLHYNDFFILNFEKFNLELIGATRLNNSFGWIMYGKDGSGSFRIRTNAKGSMNSPYLQCDGFDAEIEKDEHIGITNDDFLETIRREISCDDINKDDLIFNFEHFQHIPQNLIDYLSNEYTLFTFGTKVNTRNFMGKGTDAIPFPLGECSLIAGFNEKVMSMRLLECTGDYSKFKETLTQYYSSEDDTEISDYNQGTLLKSSTEIFDIMISYVGYKKKCDDTYYISLDLNARNMNSDKLKSLAEEIIEKATC